MKNIENLTKKEREEVVEKILKEQEEKQFERVDFRKMIASEHQIATYLLKDPKDVMRAEEDGNPYSDEQIRYSQLDNFNQDIINVNKDDTVYGYNSEDSIFFAGKVKNVCFNLDSHEVELEIITSPYGRIFWSYNIMQNGSDYEIYTNRDEVLNELEDYMIIYQSYFKLVRNSDELSF